MKTKVINLYSFSELSEEAQQNAIEKLWDINVDYDWWEFIYEDAAAIGLEIKGFDLYHRDINGQLKWDALEVAQDILNEHGEQAETYLLASNFLDEHAKLFEIYSKLEADENSDYSDLSRSEDDLVDLESEFTNELLQEYLTILDKEYEYLTSREAIIEAIDANEYEFNKDGGLE